MGFEDDRQHSWRRVALGLRPVCSGGHSQSSAKMRDLDTYKALHGVWDKGFEQGKTKGLMIDSFFSPFFF